MYLKISFYLKVLLLLYACNNHVRSDPHGGGNGQWSNPRVGMIGDRQQQHQGFAGGQQQGYNGQQQGYGGQRGFGGNNFGGQQNGGGRYQGQGRGGQQQWQSGQGSEAYKTNVFNEPDRYGYDSTFPGATVHYLVYKKRKFRFREYRSFYFKISKHTVSRI